MNDMRKFKFATTFGVILVVILGVVIGLVFGFSIFESDFPEPRKFTIDYDNNVFRMNNRPFQYVSGSFHYFRAIPQVWQQRLRTMRAAGLNTIDTYIEWSLHNPFDGEYDFDGIADIEKFLDLATQEGFYVILRPGPYICAERDNGGLPYWLFNKYPNIKVRTSDENYLNEVRKWFEKLMPKIQPHLFGNGGPIIMIQIENEYGASKLCDREYLNWLHRETVNYVQDNAILFTTDMPIAEDLRCGKIEDVLATTVFGVDQYEEIDEIWEKLREVQPKGPLVNSEFYVGWLSFWQEEIQNRDADLVAKTLRKILEINANVNIFMFFGGTNFGFTSGAVNYGPGKYMSDITSYDYDAVMNEAGDSLSIKYIKVRSTIGQFLELPIIPVPNPLKKTILPDIQLNSIGSLFSQSGRKFLARSHYGSQDNTIVTKDYPITFEELNQFSGLVLYETDLPVFEIDPTVLTVNDLRDRALIYIDDVYIGTLSRANGVKSIAINAGIGSKLQILVENQGRTNFEIYNDTKGILDAVTIQKRGEQTIELTKWTMTGYPLTKYRHIEEFIQNKEQNELPVIAKNGLLTAGPVVFSAIFDVNDENDLGLDTFLDPTGWGKGVLYINGFNLGRYWPLVGPQITLYVPGNLLQAKDNVIVMIEYQRTDLDRKIKFTDTPNLDGKKL